eukprot:CAMPEP_0178730838 /NCGR_PEP_ID=MMETSP0699-20121125/29731_1 /TAXON_ID=265572 /ORGANISM="Extubocellulus spinifer, Strain CCMP396" /LENGTH=445 /DNA_ID=CAMNT_0020382887 /DNA_START=42 /DNA_END=1376 /DNA_ORIENTATION=+
MMNRVFIVPPLFVLAAFPSAVAFVGSSPPSSSHIQGIRSAVYFQHFHLPSATSLSATSSRRRRVNHINPCIHSKLGFLSSQSSKDDTPVFAENMNPPSNEPKKKRRPNARMQLFQWLNQPSVEILSALAVLLSSFLVALDTFEDLPSLSALSDILGQPVLSDPHVVIDDTLQVINSVFFVDFFVRWYAAGNFKARYLTKPLVTLDIIVVLMPLFLGGLLPYLAAVGIAGPDGLLPSIPDALQLDFSSAGLQNLLLLRILRLRRILTDINTFSRFEMALGVKPRDVRPYQLQLARVLLSLFTLLSVASGLIYTCEHEVNPEIPDYFAALYFGLTTLTTVGFGDIAPVTPQGRLTVCVSILAGVAVIPAQATKLVDAVVAFQQEQKKGGPRVTVRAGSSARNGIASQISSVQLREASERSVVVTKSSASSVAEKLEPSEVEGRFEGW